VEVSLFTLLEQSISLGVEKVRKAYRDSASVKREATIREDM